MMPIKNFLNKKTVFLTLGLFIVSVAAVYVGVTINRLSKESRLQKTSIENYSKETIAMKDSYAKIQLEFGRMQSDYARLQKDHTDLAAEHDKLNAENKEMFEVKDQAKELEASYEIVKKDRDAFEKTNQDLLEVNLALKGQNKDLEVLQKQLIREKEQLQENLDRVSDKTGFKKSEQQNADLQKKNTELESALKEKDAALKKAQELEAKAKAEAAQLSRKLGQVNENYSEAVDKNKRFEQKVVDDPAKFAELAHQNKVLIKQTANMHYNLGVFYSNRKEYSRAIAEFEKAVELAPDDAYSHFNLGYIYAEHVVNRGKATRHFQQYLRYAKKDDKDVDWVKKYIITWQAYQGKEPMD